MLKTDTTLGETADHCARPGRVRFAVALCSPRPTAVRLYGAGEGFSSEASGAPQSLPPDVESGLYSSFASASGWTAVLGGAVAYA